MHLKFDVSHSDKEEDRGLTLDEALVIAGGFGKS